MRLLIVLPSLGRGGAEGYALTVAKAAVNEGWEVHLAMQNTLETASLIHDFCSLSVHYHPLNIGEIYDPKVETPGKHLLRCLKTVDLLLRLKPDVVQIVLSWQNLGRGSIFACGLLQIPTMVVFQLAPQKLSFSSKMQSLYAWAQARNQQWVAVSEQNKRVISDSFNLPLDRIQRIYNGASLEVNHQSQNEIAITTLRDRLRHELGLSRDSRIILTVGRLCWQKGHHLLAQTIPHLIQNFADIHFVWVGTGESQEALAQQLQEYGVAEKVSLLGGRSDVPDLLRASDLFVFPTLYEGQPFALLEAMAIGCPVVSADASGIPEVITHEVHGVLCRTNDSCDLFAAIHWALQHPAEMQAMATRAIERAKEFSEVRMLRETLGQLQEMAAEKKPLQQFSSTPQEGHGKPDFARY